MKRLFLCSSFADVADLLPELAGKERGTVTFIPTAALHEEYNLYVEEGRAALERLGYTVEELGDYAGDSRSNRADVREE